MIGTVTSELFDILTMIGCERLSAATLPSTSSMKTPKGKPLEEDVTAEEPGETVQEATYGDHHPKNRRMIDSKRQPKGNDLASALPVIPNCASKYRQDFSPIQCSSVLYLFLR